MNAGKPCWHCQKGSLMRDLGGNVSCVNCGAGPEPPVLASASPVRKGTNRPRWDRVTATPWQAA